MANQQDYINRLNALGSSYRSRITHLANTVATLRQQKPVVPADKIQSVKELMQVQVSQLNAVNLYLQRNFSDLTLEILMELENTYMQHSL